MVCLLSIWVCASHLFPLGVLFALWVVGLLGGFVTRRCVWEERPLVLGARWEGVRRCLCRLVLWRTRRFVWRGAVCPGIRVHWRAVSWGSSSLFRIWLSGALSPGGFWVPVCLRIRLFGRTVPMVRQGPIERMTQKITQILYQHVAGRQPNKWIKMMTTKE